VSFQSRLGPVPWIRPYTDEVLEELAKEGKKKVLALSPAFVADCLETTLEVGEQYKHDFLDSGGEVWDLVESLNDHPIWIECLKDLVLQNDANADISEEKIPNKKTSDELSSSISRQRL
jgi:ferrochelatase